MTNQKTTKINDLKLIDPATGQDFLHDVWGEDESITYNEDTGKYESDQETCEFWHTYTANMRVQLDRKKELLETLEEPARTALLEDIHENMACDLENEPETLAQILDRHEQ